MWSPPTHGRVWIPSPGNGEMRSNRTILRAASIATLGIVATSCGGSSDGPNGSPALKNTIVFVSNRSGVDELYAMNADGSGARKIPTLDGQKSYPAVSPNGLRIAFTVGDLQTSGTSSIYVAALDGTMPVRLTTEQGVDYMASWSPDGTRIAFVSTRDDNSEIYVMSADGSSQTNLTNNPANDARPSWSPSQNTILFQSDRLGETDIYTMTSTGTSVTPVITGSDPHWSPSGSRFLYKQSGQIWVYNVSDTPTTAQITTQAGFYFTPGWSIDESKITYANTTNDHEEIWAVSSADGSGATQLTPDDQGDSYYPSWTRH
jgi:Tol biopolymer transport system component